MPNIEDCLRQLMAIHGAICASVIDYPTGLTVGSLGRGPNGPDGATSAGAVRLVHATADTAAFATVGRPGQVEDIVITAGNGYHLVHLLVNGFDGRLVLYVWLDRMLGNIAMTQRSLHSIGAQLSAT